MFSPQIQSYINSSSHSSALNRVNELNNYIDTFYPPIEEKKTSNVSAFDKI